MARDDDEDLYDEEFDFVDDDEEEDQEVEEESSADDSELADEDASDLEADGEPEADDDEPVDEFGRPEPAANYVVHVYEHKKFKRTIDHPFTPEDAEAFASEYNRTAKNYGRLR